MIKNTLLGLLAMVVVSVVSLIVLSTFTFLFKWQAPQAQVGIILTYILSGLAGGMVSAIFKNRGENSLSKKLISGFTLGTIYMVMLLLISIAVSANSQWDMGQIVLIWILLCCSSVLGISLKPWRDRR